MKRFSLLPVSLLLLIILVFFYPIFKGWIPFPGDLVVSTPPYSTQSFLGYAPGGVPNKAQGPDVIRESMPWKFFAITSFKKARFLFGRPTIFRAIPSWPIFRALSFIRLMLFSLVFPF